MTRDNERDFYLSNIRHPHFADNNKVKIDNNSSYDILVIPDVHSYERDKYAYDLLLNTVFPAISKDYNIKKVIQLGDLLECGQYSRYSKSNINEQTETVSRELDWAVNDFWKPLKSDFSDSEMLFVEGNHENRWHSYISNNIKDEELASEVAALIDPCTIFEQHGITCARYGAEDLVSSSIKLTDNLYAVHGWSFAKHAAATHLDKVNGTYSILFGHTHRMQSFTKVNPITRKLVGAWSFGALAKLGMFYQKGMPSDHCLGFGIVSVSSSGTLQVNTIKIDVNGKHRSVQLPNGTHFSTI